MSDARQHLSAIEAWLQQEDDELLYVPGRSSLGRMQVIALPNYSLPRGDSQGFARTAQIHLSHMAVPYSWVVPRLLRWNVFVPYVSDSTCEDLKTCFRAHDGMRRSFWGELPANDGEGHLPRIQQCIFLPEDDVLILRAWHGPEGPSQRCRVRFDGPILAFIEESPDRSFITFGLVEALE